MGSDQDQEDVMNQEDQPRPVTEIVLRDETGFSRLISEVSQELIPTVVHISITGTVEQGTPDIPFFRFFEAPPEREVPIQALGSGVIVSEQGHIITNYHVIRQADEIEVVLHTGRAYTAEVIGSDPQTDLAVIKIDPVPGMRYAELGDSEAVEIGEWVIAIGSPRGFQQTVTAGIVSAKNRSNIGALGPQGYEDFIQTDAAINPGNSGGPLINLEGKVIGINSLIISSTRGFEGMGFAIPSNMAEYIAEQLIQEGEVTRGFLGVQIQNLTPEMRESLDLDPEQQGIIVADVTPDGPAEQAGIEQGDIIVSYNGRTIESTTDLRNLVARTQPGADATVTVLRDGESRTFDVEIGDLGGFQQAQADAADETLGMSLQPVTAETARRLGLENEGGLLVTAVAPDGPAARVGIVEGTVVLRVGRAEVNTVAEFRNQIEKNVDRGQVLLLVFDPRSENTLYVTVPLE
jgi:serine protease Do